MVYIRCMLGIYYYIAYSCSHGTFLFNDVIYLVYVQYIPLIYIYGICSFSGFRGQHHSRPDPVPQNTPDDVLPDPDDLADFELPDQQALIDAFLDGLCKECDHPDAVFPFRSTEEVR